MSSEYPLVDKLQELKKKYISLSEQLSDPVVMGDMKKFIQLNREYKELEPIAAAGDKYCKMVQDLEGAKEILLNEKDEDLRDLAKEELSGIESQIPVMEEEIKLLLIPKDPQDDKNAIVEIRGGTGGDEAAIFAGDLYRMYAKFCERKGWKLEINSQSEGASGGYKEIIFKVSGQGVYGVLKYESGVHRVQRVPQTETQGRVHTSASSIVVLPEADEFDVELNMNDIRKDTFCSSGPDEDLRDLAKEELSGIESQIPVMEEEIKLLLIPKDPQDDKNAIVEIRGGTGGDEAAIFAGDLYRMYAKFCERKGWKLEINSQSEGASGGYKEIIFKVSGQGVYGVLKYESGVHRVQRVPQTETQGRVHTSASSIVVLPEADEFDVELNMNDIRKDTFCSSGPGGQSVNTTYSAIRLTHIPTGLVVQCQDEKSQLKNYDKALAELRTRLYNMEYEKYLNEMSKKRKTMVSTGDRSAKIRTYNYPQSRVTDHRINYTMYNLPVFMDGDIQEVIDQLQIAENAERLKAEE